MTPGRESGLYECKLCTVNFLDKNALIEHLKTEHEALEIISFAAVTMIDEEDRDASAAEFNRRFQGLTRIVGE
ncbi:MAG: C2H2-type zinc finger protein [Nitrososphaerales archaeon]|nr:C2H2-type zinc finger protein [Nitrososphaerales archaeon]